MPHSPASDSLLLPFGSLMGSIPVDSVQQGRELGDFSGGVASLGQRMSEIQQQIHSVIDPEPAVPLGGPDHRSSEFVAAVPFRGFTACAASPPSRPSGDGGI